MNGSCNSFTYFISSVNRTVGTECYDCTIDIGPVGYNYDEYHVQCIALYLNMDTMGDIGGDFPSFYHLVADDFAENVHNTFRTGTNSLSNRQIVLGIMADNGNAGVGVLNGGQGSSFIVKDLRKKRSIRFRLYDDVLTPEDGTHTDTNTNWSCILLFKPIK